MADLFPGETPPIATDPILRGVDLALGRLIQRDCFTERTLRVLDELRGEVLSAWIAERREGRRDVTEPGDSGYTTPPGSAEPCRGDSGCSASPHWHGCYADTAGDCDDPAEHSEPGGSR